MHTFLIKINNLMKSVHDFFKINPHKHWVILVRLFLSLVLILILLSFYLLYQIKNEKIFQVKTDQKTSGTLLKDDLLKNTTDFFDTRAVNTDKINNAPSPYKDPSI